MNTETIMMISTVIQAVTAVVITVATIAAVRISVRMFQVAVEPQLDFSITGHLENNVVFLQNLSNCDLVDVEIRISVGLRNKDGKAERWRYSIATHRTRRLKPGARKAIPNLLSTPGDLGHYIIDFEDLIIHCTYKRWADHRLFQFKAPIYCEDELYDSAEYTVETAQSCFILPSESLKERLIDWFTPLTWRSRRKSEPVDYPTNSDDKLAT